MTLFNSWEDIVRLLVVGTLGYFGLILFLRISGKRTLSKLNAFDLVVTVALGSTLATTLLTKSISLAEGLMAFALLIGLQYLIAWTSVRSKIISQAIKSEPTLLLHNGHMLHSAMRRERIAPSEILQALRSQGVDSIESVDSMVLENDGSFSILSKTQGREASTMSDVKIQSKDRD